MRAVLYSLYRYRVEFTVSLAILVGLWLTWSIGLEIGEIRLTHDVLPKWSVIAIEFAAATTVIGSLFNLRPIANRIRRQPRLILILSAILILCLMSSMLLRKPKNILLFDEFIYAQTAQMLLHGQKATFALEADIDNLGSPNDRSEYNKEPPAFALLLSWFSRVFGFSKATLFFTNLIIEGLSVIFIFCIGFFLSRSASIATISSFVFGLNPVSIIFSRTWAAEPSAACASILVMCIGYLFVNRPSRAKAIALIAAFAWSSYFRPESILIALPLLLLVGAQKSSTRKILLQGWPFLLFLVPLFLHFAAFTSHRWGSHGSKFSLSAAHFNRVPNAAFFFSNQFFPAVYSVLAILGLFAGRLQLVQKLVLLTWFLSFWLVFVFFYAGNYQYGVNSRYALLCLAPLALLAGFGFHQTIKRLTRLIGKPISILLIASATLLSLLRFPGYISYFPKGQEKSRTDIRFSDTIAAKLPKRSFVYSHVPSLWLVQGISSGQSAFALETHRIDETHLFQRFPGGIYFHWDVWCGFFDRQGKCDHILRKYVTKEYAVRTDTGPALYRLIRLR